MTDAEIDPLKFESYLGVVPTVLYDGKAVLQAMEDTPEMWTLVNRMVQIIRRANAIG